MYKKKIYLEDYKSPWKALFNAILIPVGGRLILHCNFDTSKLGIYLSTTYLYLDTWSEVNAKTPCLLHEVANEVIWNNKLLCINKTTRSFICMTIKADTVLQKLFLGIKITS